MNARWIYTDKIVNQSLIFNLYFIDINIEELLNKQYLKTYGYYTDTDKEFTILR